MQFGASNESGDTGNIDDCMIMLGTKLTVSMRDGNAGKSRNNLIVGTKVDEAVKLTKEYPATGNEIISKQITGKIVLDYGRDSELRICGDEIVPEINMENANASLMPTLVKLVCKNHMLEFILHNFLLLCFLSHFDIYILILSLNISSHILLDLT